jgi:hypothetical protein
MTPRDLYSSLLNTEQCLASHHSTKGYHEVYHDASLANVASHGGGKLQYRHDVPSSSVGANLLLLRPPPTQAVALVPAALRVVLKYHGNSVDLMVILPLSATVTSSRIF